MSVRQVLTAIIYDRRGRVLSIGQNSYIKTHPLQAHHARKVGADHRIYLHAEIAAIIRCPNISRAWRMQIIRIGRNGQAAKSAPCAVCMSALAATPIRIIDHT